jgi:hypothetical protein
VWFRWLERLLVARGPGRGKLPKTMPKQGVYLFSEKRAFLSRGSYVNPDAAPWECCENGGLDALDDHSRDTFMTQDAVIAPLHRGNPHEQRPNSQIEAHTEKGLSVIEIDSYL